jgi:methyl-CpG-binding domain protein 4
VGNSAGRTSDVGNCGELVAYHGQIVQGESKSLNWIPPKYGLVQEKYWPDGWKILVCCLCLNLTTRRQMEPVVEEMFRRWPTPGLLASCDVEELQELIKPLGMWRRRAATLIKMSRQYCESQWVDVEELTGVGQYARRAYEIFILGKIGEHPPNDHALLEYWNFLRNKDGKNEQSEN